MMFVYEFYKRLYWEHMSSRPSSSKTYTHGPYIQDSTSIASFLFFTILFLFLDTPQTMIYLLIYMALVGAYSFILFGIDKYKSKYQKWRVSEKHILTSIALGWWIGWVLGMSYFRHKTQKSSFLWRFWIFVFLWVIITVVALLYIQ